MSCPTPTVHTLLCHAHVPMALACCGSLLRCHRPAPTLCVHDDGSLIGADREQLTAALPGVVFADRAETAARAEAALREFPACREYRRQQPMAVKLFDIPLAARAAGGPLVYCDSDIFFLRPFTGFGALWARVAPRPVFTRDFQSSYAMRYWQLLGPRRLRLVERVNSGVILLDPARLDFGLMEDILGRSEAGFLPHLEQTIWAALARREGGRLISPEQVTFPPLYVGGAANTDAVAWHFVTLLREQFDEFLRRWEAAALPDAPAVELAVVPTRALTFPGYVRSRLGKQLRLWRWNFQGGAASRPPAWSLSSR